MCHAACLACHATSLSTKNRPNQKYRSLMQATRLLIPTLGVPTVWFTTNNNIHITWSTTHSLTNFNRLFDVYTRLSIQTHTRRSHTDPNFAEVRSTNICKYMNKEVSINSNQSKYHFYRAACNADAVL